MRNFIVLGASALVLALGVAQASAIPSTEQWQQHVEQQHALWRRSPTATCAISAPRRSIRAPRSNDPQGPSLYPPRPLRRPETTTKENVYA